jgi:hypothetical protein
MYYLSNLIYVTHETICRMAHKTLTLTLKHPGLVGFFLTTNTPWHCPPKVHLLLPFPLLPRLFHQARTTLQ